MTCIPMTTMRRTGNPLAHFSLCCAVVLASWLAAPAVADNKAAPSGVLAGTVFSDAGFAQPGTRVLIRALPDEGVKKPKPSEWKLVTDSRGEFAVRVPAGRIRYQIEVRADGFLPQKKETYVGIDERVELSFLLERQIN